MAGKRKENEAGSSNDLRADVLRVLGVLKVATADQIQRLSSPHLTYRHTTKPTAAKQKEARTASHRAAVNDLRRHGLAVEGGRTRGGEETRLLTKDGLAAAAIDLDREIEEMGGMPKSAGREGHLEEPRDRQRPPVLTAPPRHPIDGERLTVRKLSSLRRSSTSTPGSLRDWRRTPTASRSRCGAPAGRAPPCDAVRAGAPTGPARLPPGRPALRQEPDGPGRRPHPPPLARAVASRGRLPLLRPLHPDRGDHSGGAARTRPGRARLLALRTPTASRSRCGAPAVRSRAGAPTGRPLVFHQVGQRSAKSQMARVDRQPPPG
ncbi:hypothetical protein SUDANB174_07744 (plasmid) [Streptomyces sp. enrichment culture]